MAKPEILFTAILFRAVKCFITGQFRLKMTGLFPQSITITPTYPVSMVGQALNPFAKLGV